MNHESDTAAAPGGEQAADHGEQAALGSPSGPAASILKKRSARVAAAAAAAAAVALIVVLVRGCGGAEDPAASLSSAADKIASTLNAGDSGLVDEADEVAGAARRLAGAAEPDYGDLEDLDATIAAVEDVDGAIREYMSWAAGISESAASEGRAEAALGALRRAATFVTNSSWHAEWTNLERIRWTLDLERNARRYDEKDLDRYVGAREALEAAWAAHSKAWAEMLVAKAQLRVASYGSGAERQRARDALEDAEQILDDAADEHERAYDDAEFFRGLITWRDG